MKNFRVNLSKMTDCFSRFKRSAVMRAVKSSDTAPEMRARKALFAAGYRFRLHRKDLPGRPDIVLPRFKMALFVHGCFWHGHDCQRGARKPKTNSEYWAKKIKGNQIRDKAVVNELTNLGWQTATIWECQTRDLQQLADMLDQLLDEKCSFALPLRDGRV